MNRREFVQVVTGCLGALMGAVIGLPAIGYLISPATKRQESEAWIPLGVLENYPVGVPTLFNFTRTKTNGWEKTVNSYGVFVVRGADNSVMVISNRCTHLSCRVNWSEEKQEFLCPCHDAQFDINGKVLGGPPPRPLDTYANDTVKIEDGNLFIFFQEG
jgi:Rieske Fe-S protein